MCLPGPAPCCRAASCCLLQRHAPASCCPCPACELGLALRLPPCQLADPSQWSALSQGAAPPLMSRCSCLRRQRKLPPCCQLSLAARKLPRCARGPSWSCGDPTDAGPCWQRPSCLVQGGSFLRLQWLQGTRAGLLQASAAGTAAGASAPRPSALPPCPAQACV